MVRPSRTRPAAFTTWAGGSAPMGPISDVAVIACPPGGSSGRPIAQGAPDALRCERQVPDLDPGGVPDGRPDGRRDAQQGALAHPLRAVRARAVLVLDGLADQLQGQVHARRDTVVDRAEVPDPSLLVVDVVLHEGVPQALDGGALV